jgi:hypothetical protein
MAAKVKTIRGPEMEPFKFVSKAELMRKKRLEQPLKIGHH